ncbi:MAG TPA: hypothetical protein VLS47_09435 [Gallionella sp.]|nr:hypothetical protein [Gallionella sp.]
MQKNAKMAGVIKEENSRRSFFRKAAAALGVVAAAVYTRTLISRSSAPAGDASAKYAADVALQEKAVTGNRLILMSDDEKKQRLEELLNCHYQEIA